MKDLFKNLEIILFLGNNLPKFIRHSEINYMIAEPNIFFN